MARQRHSTKRGPGRVHCDGYPRKRRRFASASEQRRYEFHMLNGPHAVYFIPRPRRFL